MKALNELLWSQNFTGNEFDREAVKELCANLTQGEILQLLMELKKDRHNKCFNGNFSVKEIVFYLQENDNKVCRGKKQKSKNKRLSRKSFRRTRNINAAFYQKIQK